MSFLFFCSVFYIQEEGGKAFISMLAMTTLFSGSIQRKAKKQVTAAGVELPDTIAKLLASSILA